METLNESFTKGTLGHLFWEYFDSAQGEFCPSYDRIIPPQINSKGTVL
jgi:hypothetical protein